MASTSPPNAHGGGECARPPRPSGHGLATCPNIASARLLWRSVFAETARSLQSSGAGRWETRGRELVSGCAHIPVHACHAT